MPDDSDILKALESGGTLEFNQALIDAYGGYKGLVSKFRDLWDDERTTPAVKSQMAVFMMKNIADANAAKGKQSWETMTEEQLETAALKLIARYKGKLPWETPNDHRPGNSQGTEG